MSWFRRHYIKGCPLKCYSYIHLVQSFQKTKCWFFHWFYLFCKKSNRRLEFNDTGFFFSFVGKKEVQHSYRGGGGHIFYAKFTINLPYIYPIFSQKNPIFLKEKWKVAWHPVKFIIICGIIFLFVHVFFGIFCF